MVSSVCYGMRTRQRYCISVVLTVTLVSFVLFLRLNSSTEEDILEDISSDIPGNISNDVPRFLVYTPVCRIPDVHPYDATVKHVIGKGDKVKCEKYQIFTYEHNNHIYIDWNKVNKSSFKGELNHCRFWPIVRPVSETSDHNSLAYLQASPRFNNSIVAEHEHIHVKCFNRDEHFLFESFHTLIFDKVEVEKRTEDTKSKIQQSHPQHEIPLNVQIIVVDSVSRLNSLRFMTRTRNYLINEMNAVDMKGYNKVGYGTFHNMIPVLSGKFYEELPYDFRNPTIFDNFTFLWNLYSNHGFRTYYAEDYPMGTMFDYNKKGFQKTPTDYYNRHLLLSMYRRPGIVYNHENCILHQLQTQWVLDPTYKFLKHFRNRSYFSIVLLTRLTHDKLERTAAADEVYFKFFKDLNENEYLNNTVLVLMADHGMRFGPIRTSYIGLLEERLPMLYIAFPKWFSKRYPLRMRNIEINSRRLTTPFDLHRTLADALSFDGVLSKNNIKNRGLNLLRVIPENRKCEDAGIESHWCTCDDLKGADIKSHAVQDAANFLVGRINHLLKDVSSLCETLGLAELLQSYQAKIKDENSADKKHLTSFKIVLRTVPGGGLFEGTVTYNSFKKLYTMKGEISRINAYSGEKRCNVNYLQERLCYCKSNRKK